MAKSLKRPELSVIIPAHNAESTLAPLLEVLLAQSWSAGFEVVVANNRSTDGTASIVGPRADTDPRLRLVSADAQFGPAYARNAGVNAARGSHLAFCDADDLVSAGWVEAMGSALRQHELVTGPLELDRLNPSWVSSSRGRSYASEIHLWQGIVPCVWSCNFGIRRRHFEESGGFDESFRVGEDIELSMRLWQMQVRVAFVPQAVVHYRLRDSQRALWRQGRTFGAADVRLNQRLRELGVSGLPTVGWKTWLWLPRNAHRLFSKRGRARWLWVASTKVGQILGVLRRESLQP